MRALLVLAFAYAACVTSLAQRLPENDDNRFLFDIQPEVLFYDTKVLPDGKEVTVFLPRNETKRFFFVVEQNRKPVYFALTPCSSVVDWKLYFRYQSVDPDDEQRLDDPLSQQRELLRRPKRSKRLLQSFSGNEMMTYVSREFRTGLFIMEALARDRHATALLYATATPDAEMPYPEVPQPSTVDVIQSDSDSVTVAWKASPSEVTWGQFVEYCVGYNTRRNYRTLCALNADRQGEIPPPVPQKSGFGFHWEKAHAKHVSRMRKTMLEGKMVGTFRDIHVECVGRRTWFTMTPLRPGTQYFVDVFAISPATNRSAAYRGTSFVSEGAGEPITLHDKHLLYMSLRHRQGASALFRFPIEGGRAARDGVVIDVLPCYGRLNVEVLRGKDLLMSNSIHHLHKFHIRNTSAGDVLTLRVAGDAGQQTQGVKVLATRHTRRDPFPDLGNNTRVQSLDNLVTCSSVTLSWSAPDEKALYCLYKRREGHSIRRLFTRQDLCNPQDIAKRSEKVFCRRYRRSHKQRVAKDTIRETVSALKSNTIYIFELLLTRRKGETLSYESIRVATREKC